ncbi:hypothetical protein L4X63_09860 [Geomonas sp. Red32]|uniref:hypothetical protein n=1 Tax=Geomonas sp. Red32 TaxID=2912856 RepID=UPI00202CDD3A|nr:hypothetical protein [Geomonas sp. Red32]MCM0081894.1 hypothetical protein [Geomonas sp. Red32]
MSYKTLNGVSGSGQDVQSVAAMVIAVLEDTGERLWGRNLWKKNYSVYFSRGRWVLSDGRKQVLTGRREASSVKLSVQMEERGFYLAFEKLSPPLQPQTVRTGSHLESELRETLWGMFAGYATHIPQDPRTMQPPSKSV